MAAIANKTNLEIRKGDLTDEQWKKLESLLPPQKPKTGRPGHDHRQIINGILWILRTGAPWRDLPDCYGVHSTVSSRFYRWQKAGIWDEIWGKIQIMADYQGKIDWEVHMGDSTVVRAHQHAAGAIHGAGKPSSREECRRIFHKNPYSSFYDSENRWFLL